MAAAVAEYICRVQLTLLWVSWYLVDVGMLAAARAAAWYATAGVLAIVQLVHCRLRLDQLIGIVAGVLVVACQAAAHHLVSGYCIC